MKEKMTVGELEPERFFVNPSLSSRYAFTSREAAEEWCDKYDCRHNKIFEGTYDYLIEDCGFSDEDEILIVDVAEKSANAVRNKIIEQLTDYLRTYRRFPMYAKVRLEWEDLSEMKTPVKLAVSRNASHIDQYKNFDSAEELLDFAYIDEDHEDMRVVEFYGFCDY